MERVLFPPQAVRAVKVGPLGGPQSLLAQDLDSRQST